MYNIKKANNIIQKNHEIELIKINNMPFQKKILHTEQIKKLFQK